MEEYNEDEEDGYMTDDSVDPDNMTYEVGATVSMFDLAVGLCCKVLLLSREAPSSATTELLLALRILTGNLSCLCRSCKPWGRLWARSRAASHRTSLMRFPTPNTPAASQTRTRLTVRAFMKLHSPVQ